MTDATAWRGRVGEVWASERARTERAFAQIAEVLERSILRHAPERGRAADVGCGVGSTALALAAARPELHVTGVDLSPALIAAAHARSVDGRPDFIAGDVGEVLPAMAPLDLLVSRHGVMFFADPVAGFTDLRRVVRPGAPLIFSCFRRRAENEWVTAADDALGANAAAGGGVYAPGPFAFGEAGFVHEVLRGAGWIGSELRAHDVDYVVGGGTDPIEDALAFYRRIGPAASILAAATDEDRHRYEARLRDLFATRIRDGAVTFTAAIWVVSALAGKELP